MARENNRHKGDSKETLGKVIASNLFSLLKIFLLCLVAVYGTFNYLVKPTWIYGVSMYPTLKDGAFVVSNAFVGHFMDVHRQDIVIAYDSKFAPVVIVKRVIGLPGDTIYAKNDIVYVNGKPLDEPYLESDYARTFRELQGSFTSDFGPVTLGEDEYFLMGDNRVKSEDSRVRGPIKRDAIMACGAFVILKGK
jgi:signal peptidase I